MPETNVAMTLLKANLGFFNTPLDPALDAFLLSRLEVAAYELEETCKITLTAGAVQDEDLKAMYAAWLYRKSVTGEAKPSMLQMAIRNRQVNQQEAEEESA